MPNNRIPIFFSCDDNYAPFLGVAIKSLIKNNKELKKQLKNKGVNPDKLVKDVPVPNIEDYI